METELGTLTRDKIRNLDSLFKPKAIAIIGASAKELSIGNVIIKNLLQYGYTGKIYPINPKEKTIRGLNAYPTIFDVQGDIDLAHVIIPGKFVPQIIKDCGKRGIKSVIINSAGFSEMGTEGMELQKAFLANAKKYGVRIFGPNCQGIINTDPKIRAYCDFTFTFPEAGQISIAALSGGVGALIMQSIFDLGVGMRLYASNGNAADVSISEVINYYADDGLTKAILLYTEGFSNPREFMDVAKTVARKKPILAMKAGRTEQGAKAAASHTGSLAGVDITTELIFEKMGILAFHNEEEMCQAAMTFATQPIPKGNRVGIITNTGGPAVIATDELVSEGLLIPPLTESARAKLKETQLPEASIGNPVDVVATGGGKQFKGALDIMMEQENIDSIYVNFVTAPFTDTDEVARQIVEASNMKRKPIVCNFMTNLSIERYRTTAKILKDGGVPCYAFPTTAAKALGTLYRYRRVQDRNLGEAIVFDDVNRAKAKALLSTISGRFLTASEVYTLLSAYGIPVADWAVANNAVEAAAEARTIGFPVAVKAEASSIIHKSDAGGIALNLQSGEDVFSAAEQIRKRFVQSDHVTLKYLVQKFMPGGRELIIGASAIKGLGHIIMFGIGGVYVEVLKDITFKLSPVTKVEAAEMLDSVRMAKLLDGVRGENGIDKTKVIEIIQRISQLVTDFPQIEELDLNPIMAFQKGAFVVDARIKV